MAPRKGKKTTGEKNIVTQKKRGALSNLPEGKRRNTALARYKKKEVMWGGKKRYSKKGWGGSVPRGSLIRGGGPS